MLLFLNSLKLFSIDVRYSSGENQFILYRLVHLDMNRQTVCTEYHLLVYSNVWFQWIHSYDLGSKPHCEPQHEKRTRWFAWHLSAAETSTNKYNLIECQMNDEFSFFFCFQWKVFGSSQRNHLGLTNSYGLLFKGWIKLRENYFDTSAHKAKSAYVHIYDYTLTVL